MSTISPPLLTSPLLILVCLHSPAEAAIPTLRPTVPPDFYQVIIDNNLFRPLGWTKPKPKPAFELIATIIKSHGKHKALIRNTKTGKLHYAAIGEELTPGVTIAEITRHAVTLDENGTSKVYRLIL